MNKQNRVAFFNLLSTLLLRGLSIITAPLFSRMLGAEGYGIVSVYVVWVNVLQIALSLQTYSTLANALVEYPQDRQSGYQSSVLTLSLCFFGLCSAVILLFLGPIARLIKMPPVVVVLMLVHAIAGYCIHFINTKLTYEFRAGLNCFLSVLVAVLVMVLSILFILWMPRELDYMGRILALVVTNALVGFGSAGYILARGKKLYDGGYWKFCVALSVPMVFWALSDLALGYTDRLMLQHMMNDSMVGQYSLASAFAGIMFTIFQALNNSWVPFFFADRKEGRHEQIRRQASNFLELYTVLSVGFVLLTQEVYHVFASQEFWPGTNLVAVFVSGYYLNFLCTFPINVEYYHKKTKAVAVVTILAAAVNLSLNYLLIPLYGPMGAALATVSSHGVQFLLHYLYARFRVCRKEFPFPVALWAKYPLFYCAAVALVYLTSGLWWLRWPLGAAIGIWELLRIRRRKVLI